METINCFGHQLVLEHCNHRDYYDNPDVASAVERIFSLPEIHNRERGANWDSHHGEGATSEVNPYLGPEHISGAKELISWIKEQCFHALKLYNIDGTSIEITRSWMNQMNYKSQGRCHQHTGINQENYQPIKMNYGDSPTTYSYDLVETPDLVAIFYHVIENKLPGIYNGVSPYPVTNTELTKSIAKTLNKPFFLPNIPRFVMQLILGEMHQILFSSQHVSCRKLLDENFQFKFASLDKALNDLLK
jgi:hypothetical protein